VLEIFILVRTRTLAVAASSIEKDRWDIVTYARSVTVLCLFAVSVASHWK